MRKPNPIKSKVLKGEHIPKSRAKTSQKTVSDKSSQKSSNGSSLNDVLGKLNANQLAEVARSGFEFANNIVGLYHEREKTEQIRINAQVEIVRHASEVERTRQQEKTKRTEIEKNRNDNVLNHSILMKAEENRHEQFMKIMDLLSSGKLSEEKVFELIDNLGG